MKNPIARRITGLVLAAALAVGGVLAAGGLDTHQEPDRTEEVAGATWSLIYPGDGKGGPSTQGATWS